MNKRPQTIAARVGATGGAFWLIAAICVSSGARAEPLPIGTNTCSTEGFNSFGPSGITWNPTAKVLAISDANADEVFLVNADCQLLGSFDLQVLGSTLASGIAWDDAAQRYGIVDAASLEFLFVSEQGGELGRCDLASVGVLGPIGVTWRSQQGDFAIVDSMADNIVIVAGEVLDGSPCDVTQRLDLPNDGDDPLDTPSGISVAPDQTGFAVADFFEREVFLLNALAAPVTQFGLKESVDSRQPSGIIYVPERERYYVVDADEDELYEIDARGSSTLRCLADAIPQVSRVGFAFNERADEFVILTSDYDTSSVWFLNARSCEIQAQVSIDGLGVLFPRGLEYLPDTDELVISDEDELWFFDYRASTVHRRCDLPQTANARANDVSLFEPLDQLFVSTGFISGEVLIVDRQCNFVAQNDFLAFQTVPDDLVRQRRNGNIVSVDSQREDVFVTDFEGRALLEFATGDLDLDGPIGILAKDSVTGFVVTGLRDKGIYDWDVPLLGEIGTLTGNFVAPGRSIFLDDRGEGFVTGAVKLAAERLPVSGYYDAAAGKITLTIVITIGNPVTVTGTVTADLEELRLGPPLGRLFREP